MSVIIKKVVYTRTYSRTYTLTQTDTHTHTHTHTYIYIYIYIYIDRSERRLKSSSDDFISAVVDFLTNGTQAQKHCWKSHLVTFHKSILVGLRTFQPIFIYIYIYIYIYLPLTGSLNYCQFHVLTLYDDCNF